MISIEEIKKLSKEDKLIIGTDRVLKGLKIGKIKNVGLSSNCSSKTKEEISHYAELSKAKVTELEVPNDELGTLCKKPFAISVLGF
jgi:large subunit ribosomal protein L30e